MITVPTGRAPAGTDASTRLTSLLPTTPAVNPVLVVHKIFQADTQSSLLDPVYAYFELLTTSFVMPTVLDSCTLIVADSRKYSVGQYIWINGIGFLKITGTPSLTTIYVQNLGSTGNSVAGTTVPVGTVMAPSIPVAAEVDDSLVMSGQSGVEESVVTTNANDTLGRAVVFPTEFASAPTSVLLSMGGSTLGAVFGSAFYARDITKTGFNIFYCAGAAYTVDIHWVAIV